MLVLVHVEGCVIPLPEVEFFFPSRIRRMQGTTFIIEGKAMH